MLGAQNCHTEDRGAYTGEVSPLQLKQLGCQIVCLGHAERRRPPIKETNELVAQKTLAVLLNGMIPLICIGEREESRVLSIGIALAYRECKDQVMNILDSVDPGAPIIFAYEPIWAIGKQEPADPEHVLAVIKNLRQLFGTVEKTRVEMGGVREEREESPVEARPLVRFLYGGSAKPGTWATLKDGVDGLFLGRFAHDVASFQQVVKEMEDS